jgi:hypothetical protein
LKFFYLAQGWKFIFTCCEFLIKKFQL